MGTSIWVSVVVSSNTPKTYPDFDPLGPEFDGATYEPARDKPRLQNLQRRVYEIGKDGLWRTPTQWEQLVGRNWATVGARLRDLRKARFKKVYPNNGVYHRPRGGGLWEYAICTCGHTPCVHTPPPI